jgi:hypothetical protein
LALCRDMSGDVLMGCEGWIAIPGSGACLIIAYGGFYEVKLRRF